MAALQFLLAAMLCLSISFAAEQEIGEWTFVAHETTAGKCTLLNERQIRIQSFNYDGKGPEAWFMVDINSQRVGNPEPCYNYREKVESVLIPDENGQCSSKPKAYSGKDIILTLPSNLTWKNVDFVGFYDYKYQYVFGYIKIPAASKAAALDPYKGAEVAMGDCNKQQDRILGDETLPFTC